jgi:hypothetical protein
MINQKSQITAAEPISDESTVINFIDHVYVRRGSLSELWQGKNGFKWLA